MWHEPSDEWTESLGVQCIIKENLISLSGDIFVINLK
jgi:hypothetical protein